MTPPLDGRPIVVALAGPNGAGKSTFYHAYLRPAGLRFINADDVGRALRLGPYEAAEMANQLRRTLVQQRESFVFETVLSDPVGDKVRFMSDAARSGYTVVMCFVGLDRVATSEQRVAMRVLQGGHDVPSDKLTPRFARTLANLRRAVRELPFVIVYDNSDLHHPFRKVAEFRDGEMISSTRPLPGWLNGAIR